MARSGVQYEDVQRAIDDLLARGETPSVQKIREVLGTGSFTTISDHLREWRAHREANRDVPPPRGMPAALQELAETLWQSAQEAANQALGHYREEAERRVEEANAALAQARRQAEDAEQRESALATHLANTEQRLEERSNALARSEVERDALAEQVTKLGANHHKLEAQLSRLQQQKEAASSDHQQALANLETQHRERLAQEEHRHESAEARLMGLLDEARRERQAAEKGHAARVSQLEKRQEQLERQIQEARALLGEEEKRHRETSWARSRAEEQSLTREHEQSLLQARIDEQKRLLEDQARRLRDLEAQLHRCLWQSPPENTEGPAVAEPSPETKGNTPKDAEPENNAPKDNEPGRTPD
ncbi:DNA-binding protein [Halomonas urumqiensis]|uniref:KfrA N-terminal DNA-binding domain-containing protein n=1 Tax=Halomonas urumqiensis TaxID=1684789 RepID=A0A2N7UEV4_9GAMM|nr:DNA-binding protein [Halomonas urumqiensis]PMR78911.1 hypothetical protein C1H70_14215 [Halomonas urumqiensis]PTB04183.1 hypothetical protein C6V82_06970 [Halomonas urumqiensis]GHE19545.1 hypothetical protein GCM10017767_00660 [Halomonas urumqiensis]